LCLEKEREQTSSRLNEIKEGRKGGKDNTNNRLAGDMHALGNDRYCGSHNEQ
jgi:hypothetical protein